MKFVSKLYTLYDLTLFCINEEQMSNVTEHFFSFYEKLIAINSINSENLAEDNSNEGVIDLLADFLATIGFTNEKFLVKDNPKKYNLISSYIPKNYPLSTINRTIDGKLVTTQGYIGGIAFSGHTDTVPTDITKWHTNPFTTQVIDNKLYGLGVIDMKGFFAFVTQTLCNVNLEKITKPIYVLATADEETTMLGAQELVKVFNHQPDLIVIGEPTSMVPIIMHKGHVVQTIKVKGQSGHSSNPDSGLNAIKVMHKIVGELLKLENTLKTKYCEPLFPIPYPTLNLGTIQGGDAPNRICESCELSFDIRPIPHLSSQVCTTETLLALKDIINLYPNAITITKPYAPVEPFDGHITAELKELLKTVTRNDVTAVNYATEATYFQNLAPTVVLGAGDIALAHQANEYLDLEEVEPMLNILEKLLMHFSA